jgi:hypothetical protein
LTPNPIGKVLSTMRKHRVRALLMGGQACILYGAAEFSRDVDLVVEAGEKNLERLRGALAALKAEPVYVPNLDQEVLERGHACHFRARIREAAGLRIDVMASLRGCDAFASLWGRRRRLNLPGIGRVAVMALADLVQAKKTQRDKDWLMLRRLVEVDYHNRSKRPTTQNMAFWLRESRTPEMLLDICRQYPGTAQRLARKRPAVYWALKGDLPRVEKALRMEENSLRSADRAYWKPLRAELFAWRQARRT